MVNTYALAGAAALALALPMAAKGSVIAAYNFGPTSTSFTYGATTLNADVSATTISSGSTTVDTADDGVGGLSTWYPNNPGANYLSVENSSTNNDIGYSVSFTVTALPGYEFTPSDFILTGGAGGSSNTRSAYIFDNVDGTPTAITATATTPTVSSSSGELNPGGSVFTAVRGAAGPPQMNSFTVTTFTASDTNLTSFTMTVYFDTQLNGEDKNIDLGLLELDGTVTQTPEPGSLVLSSIGGLVGLGMRRPRRSRTVR